jgi:hypothetical protein
MLLCACFLVSYDAVCVNGGCLQNAHVLTCAVDKKVVAVHLRWCFPFVLLSTRTVYSALLKRSVFPDGRLNQKSCYYDISHNQSSEM